MQHKIKYMEKGIKEIKLSKYGLEIVYFHTMRHEYWSYFPCDEDTEIILGVINSCKSIEESIPEIEELMRAWNYDI